LRFNKDAARRIHESKWHPLERIEPTEDGGCLWSAEVAEWREMLPWVRGWGADCEVLEPENLRKSLMREAQELAELYKVVEMKKQFIAHLRKKDKEPQYLSEHLNEVSELAGQFASKIGLEKTGRLLGILHDLGKASEKFQRYILSGEGKINPDAEEYIDPIANKGKIDHTTSGAQVIYEKLWNKGSEYRIVAQGLALCIASHHSGLIDCLSPDGENNFQRRIEGTEERTRKSEATKNTREIIESIDDVLLKEIQQEIIEKINSLKEDNDSGQTKAFKDGLFLRFLLSCLLDADRLNTADFESPENNLVRNYGKYRSWEILLERFNIKLNEFSENQGKSDVDKLRDQISQACFDFAS
ncbi:MAG: CRISPR-associated endonuclease Cas3'', partial [Ignavibacteria bacterium]|nr:CRISPR-associated endonuclease Cas3'' [Ignavibacteria bacterium]